MSNLRQAAQQALEALVEINKLSIGEHAICLPGEIDTAVDALRAALAEPEQEPVAWISEGGDVSRSKRYMDEMGFKCEPLYTTPTPRKPLTEPELHAITPTWPAPGQEWGYEEVLAFVRAIERAHGIGEQT